MKGPDHKGVVQPGRRLGGYHLALGADMPGLKLPPPMDGIPERRLTTRTDGPVVMNVAEGTLFSDRGSVIVPTLYLRKREDCIYPGGAEDANVVQLDEPVRIAYNPGWRNYYHVLLQTGFTAWLFNTYFEDRGGRFLFPPLDDTARDILRLSGVDLADCLFLNEDLTLRIPQATTLETAFGSYVYRPSTLLTEYAERVRSNVGVQTKNDKRKIYISRRDTIRRKILNETEVEDFFREAGYAVVVLSELDFESKVRLFMSADVVAGPHGAGMATLMFCKPGTRVIELCGANYLNPCLLRLGQVLGLDYTLHVSPVEMETFTPAHQTGWRINIDQLRQLV